MNTEVVAFSVPIKLLKEGSWKRSLLGRYKVKTDTYLHQELQPPYCQECAQAIEEYNNVSKKANVLGISGAIGLSILGVAASVFADVAFGEDLGNPLLPILAWYFIGTPLTFFAAKRYIKKWYRHRAGDPPRATTGVDVVGHSEVLGHAAEVIGIRLLNAEYRELFEEANKSILSDQERTQEPVVR